MGIITQEQFGSFKRDADGILYLPNGNYHLIKAFGEWCSFGERCFFGEGCKAICPFWSFQYEPPFKTEGKILHPITCRTYWEERTDIALLGCYNGIEKTIKPRLPDLLKLDKWTKCERRILESWL